MTLLDPQGLDLCDLDGDEIPELFLKVKKSTTYFPEVLNRPFFFTSTMTAFMPSGPAPNLATPFVTLTLLTTSARDATWSLLWDFCLRA